MSETVTAAAGKVIEALQELSPEDRSRVLRAASALFGIDVVEEPTQSEGARRDIEQPARKPTSLAEILSQASPATNSQRLAVFAFFREFVEGKEHFSKKDLLGYFAMSKSPKPGNYDRDFNNAVRDGWLHEDGAASYLTSIGEKAVRDGFAGKAKPRGANAGK